MTKGMPSEFAWETTFNSLTLGAQRRLENNLRCALEKDQFELAYQAKISLADGRIVGVEALLRAKDRAGLFKVLGRFMRAMAITQAGMFLSQPPMAT